MSKPRIFLSSTCYDLSPHRGELHAFLESFGFEVLNSERGDAFGVTPGLHSHTACLRQVDEADYLVLLVGGRRGGTYVGSEESITSEEFKRATKRQIPTIIFVDRIVDQAIVTYKKNPTANLRHIVDDVRVFHFVEYLRSSTTDNWIHTYSSIPDIKAILTRQFGHYLAEYSRQLRKKQERTKRDDEFFVAQLPEPMPDLEGWDQDEQTYIKNGIRKLHEILSSVILSDLKPDAKRQILKCVWLTAKYGEYSEDCIWILNDVFKGYAWSHFKGQTVLNQAKQFGILGRYEDDSDGLTLYLKFKGESKDSAVAWALSCYVEKLTKVFSVNESEAFAVFVKADLGVLFSS